MSKIEVDKVDPQSGTALEIGSSGDTITIPSGATIVNSGTATGFGDNLEWQSVETGATFTAVAGNGYPVNTTAQACTVTLPASASVGDQIIFTDYLRTWGTNALTINTNSLNYQGNSSPNPEYNTNGQSVHIVYMDATQGWIPITDDDVTIETPQAYDAEYLVVAGGAGGYNATNTGGSGRGGGGAGGMLSNFGGAAISLVPGVTYTIAVGAGGAVSTNGGNSVLSGGVITTVTATGGGTGGTGNNPSYGNGQDGGSGGGATGTGLSGGSGNTPSTTPSQGNDGGDVTSNNAAGGGGGAGAVGGDNSSGNGGVGGAGLANSITGSSVTYAGGGGGGGTPNGGAGGSGGGGAGNFTDASVAVAGTDGLGGGGGGSSYSSATNPEAAAGGDGIVILRVATADLGTASGEDSSAEDGSDTVITWLSTSGGTYIA